MLSTLSYAVRREAVLCAVALDLINAALGHDSDHVREEIEEILRKNGRR